MTSLVLVTEPEFRRAESVFLSSPTLRCQVAPTAEDALAAAIREQGARHAIVGGAIYRDGLYAALPSGSVISRFGVGHDGIDKARATAAGLLCTNTPGVLDQSVAEHTMLLLLAAARRLPLAEQRMNSQDWIVPGGVELHGKTLAIAGCGRIGRAAARIASIGFGMRVIGYARRAPAAGSRDADFETITSDFAAAVREADFLSLHMPSSPENLRFMNRERLAMLKPTAWLVNTARGAVVDEAALFDALAAGTIGGAALDVFENEPYVPVDAGRDLRTLPNVVLTPHIGSNTSEASRRMAERAIENIVLAEARRFAEMDLLNREVLER